MALQLTPPTRLAACALAGWAILQAVTAWAVPLADEPSWVSGPATTTRGMVWSDFDLDGDLDLVCVNSEARHALYINDAGTLDVVPTYFGNAAKGKFAAAAGDLDGDGFPELVVTNNNQPIRIHRNSNGTLDLLGDSTPSLQTASYVNDVILTDVDNDGRLDIVTANNAGSNAIYPNLGDLAFAPPVLVGDPISSRAVAAADLDRDGDLELAFANDDGSSPTQIYWNDGGRFEAPPLELAGPGKGQDLIFGDVNGDGLMDLIVVQSTANSQLFLGTTPSGFGQAVPIATAPVDTDSTVRGAVSASLGDIDGDGDLDLAVGFTPNAEPHPAVAIYLNVSGYLSSTPDWTYFDSKVFTYDLAFADIDGDADLDLSVARGGNLGLGKPNFVFVNSSHPITLAPRLLGDIDRTNDFSVGDVNGDYVPDVIAARDGSNLVFFGPLSEQDSAPPLSFGTMNRTLAVSLGDIDADGDLDVLCTDEGAGGALYMNAGDGAFQDSPIPVGTASARSMVLADIDADGYPDIVCANGDGQNTLYRNLGGSFPPDPTWTAAVTEATQDIAAADMDGDGDLDIICANGTELGTSANSMYLNSGGLLPQSPDWIADKRGASASVSLGDVDGDGDLDVAFGNTRTASNQAGAGNEVYENFGGTLSQGPMWTTDAAHITSMVWLADVDGDSDPDLLCVNGGPGHPSRTAIYENVDGYLTRHPVWEELDEGWSRSGIIADVDLDGDADVLLGRESGAIALHANGQALGGGERPLEPNHSPYAQNLIVFDPADGSNLVDLSLELFDSEFDPVALRFSFSREGGPWQPAAITGLQPTVGILFTGSPDGELITGKWDKSALPPDPRATLLRVELIESPQRVAIRRQIGSYAHRVGALAPERPIPRTEPTLLEAPIASVGDALGIEFVLHNDGKAPLEIRSLSSSLDNLNSTIALTPALPVLVPPRGSVPASLALTLEEPLTSSAEWVQFETSDPLAPDFRVSLSLNVVPVEIAVDLGPEGVPPVRGERAALRVTPAPGVVIDRATGFVRAIGDRSFRTLELEPVGSLYEGTIPPDLITERGLEYYIQAEKGASLYKEPASAPQVASSAQVRVNTLADPRVHHARRYRMIGVPLDFGDATVTLEDMVPALAPYDDTKARLARYVSATNRTVEPPEGITEDFRLLPGRAFWITMKSPGPVSIRSDQALSVDGRGAFALTVPPGWSQVANPFAFPVEWKAVLNSSGAPDSTLSTPVAFDPLRGSSGDYRYDQIVEVLMPFEGYFVWNDTENDLTLSIPARSAPDSLLAQISEFGDVPEPVAQRRVPDTGEWTIELTATGEDGTRSTLTAGVSATASDGVDRRDLLRPPAPPGSWVRLSAVNEAAGQVVPEFRRDLRSEHSRNQRWELVLTSSDQEVATITTAIPTPWPDDLTCFLVDRELDIVVPVPEAGTSYSVRPFESARPYRLALILGSDAFIADELSGSPRAPRRVMLDQNFPNPFNPSTSVRFGLPTRQRVNLSVFDLRGRLVAVLVDGEMLEPGYHARVWSGRSRSGTRVASGVYLIQLSTPSTTLTRKAVLIK